MPAKLQDFCIVRLKDDNPTVNNVIALVSSNWIENGKTWFKPPPFNDAPNIELIQNLVKKRAPPPTGWNQHVMEFIEGYANYKTAVNKFLAITSNPDQVDALINRKRKAQEAALIKSQKKKKLEEEAAANMYKQLMALEEPAGLQEQILLGKLL